MPKRRPAPKVHSAEEQRAIVAEIQRRNRDEGLAVSQLALAQGITRATYYNWLRRAPAPHEPSPGSPPPRPAAGEGYSVEARRSLLAEIARRLAAGETAQSACGAVKIAQTTYRRWLRQASPAPEFRAVAIAEPAVSTSLALVPAPPVALSLVPARPVVPPAAPAALSLSAPGGYRVEGLTVETAAALLRALA